MFISSFQLTRTRALWATAAALSLVACGSSDTVVAPTVTPPPAIPQLSAAVGANFAGSCADLTTSLASLANTTVTAVNTVVAGSLTVAGQPVAEHCQVLGKMFSRTSTVDGNAYAIGFEIRLPKSWNGRFFHQGNGGIDGAVVAATGGLGGGPITHALHKGFAVLSSDAGHSGPTPAFGIDPQARLDYGYQAVGKLTPMAKSVVQKTYGKAADRSYFGGCSNGGRHAMVTASRYATDYDGILAGAPGYNLPKAAVANIAGAQLYASLATTTTIASPADLETGFNVTERKLLAAAVLAKCDALDGLADGTVNDVAACKTAFDLTRDVPTCTAARDGTCLSSAQKTAIAKIFNGPTTSSGAQIYSSFPYDAGIATGSVTGGPPTGVAFWEFFAPLNLDSGAVGQIFSTPPTAFAGFDGINYVLNANLDTLVAQISATNATYTESAMGFMTPPTPTDLSALKSRGAKIMAYHGTSDQIFSVNDTEAWYKGLQANNGGDASNFARFFRVPGMGHCSGGPATDQFDMLDSLVKWVEQGTAPDKVVASARGAGNAGGVNADVPAAWAANRTRPLCAYPKIARYNGTGSVDLEASFTCSP
jgi:poly(3-hydroxybutyrate) depolymerase